MALKRSEKLLVGLGSMVGGVALLIGLGLPQWDAYTATNQQITTLNDGIKNLQAQQTSLNTQIALLEKNTDIPIGINIRTYNEENREEVIKAMLDQMVNLATRTGNVFISLTPEEIGVDAAPPPPPANGNAQPQDASATANETPPVTDGAAAQDPNAPPPLPPPVLTTFAYEFSIRGNYDTLQNFLRSLDTQKELMEVSGISLENEAGVDRAGAESTNTSAISDPVHPLKLTASIKIVLQPD